VHLKWTLKPQGGEREDGSHRGEKERMAEGNAKRGWGRDERMYQKYGMLHIKLSVP
jgi:hypothetical protein